MQFKFIIILKSRILLMINFIGV